MSKEQDVQKIQMSIDDAKERVELRDAFLRLEKNPDFDKVITKLYLQEYPLRLLRLKTSAQMQVRKPEELAYTQAKMDAVGHFNSFILATVIEGNMAEKAIEQSEAELQIAEQEG